MAFQRHQQALVNGWVPWLEERAAADQGFCFDELPTIGWIWIPVRRFIDGGMASAIREPVILMRTLNVYGDVGRVTGPLGMEDRSTIALFLVDGTGSSAGPEGSIPSLHETSGVRWMPARTGAQPRRAIAPYRDRHV